MCTDNLKYKTFNCLNNDYLNRKSEREVSEEELEVFDILKKDRMTKAETIQVKNGARMLLAKMKERKQEESAGYFPELVV